MRPSLLTLLAALGLTVPASAQTGSVSVDSGTLAVGAGARLSTPYDVTVAEGAALDTGDPATGGTLVLTGGDQTVTAATLGNVALNVGTVTLGSDLAVTGVLTPGPATLVPGPFTLRLAPTVENGAIVRLAAIAGDGSTLGAPVTFERPHLDGEGWRMIAAPLATTFQSLNDDFHTQGAPGATYPFGGAHLFAWDPEAPPAERYVAVPDFAAAMEPGRGYFFKAYGTAPGTGAPLLPTVWDVSGAEPATAVTVPLAASVEAFTLLGNPYAAPLDWHAVQAAGAFAAAYAVWDPAASGTVGGYAYYSTAGVASGAAGRYVAATQGFWAESTAGTPATLTFDRAWKAPTASPVYVGRGEGEVRQLRFSLAGEGLTATEPVALFLDGGADGPDLYDASWLAPLSADYAALTFVRPGDGAALVFEGRPAAALTQPLRLAVEATRAGTYTLAWPALDLAPEGPLSLVDLQTGTRVDLRTAADYTFEIGGSAPRAMASSVGARPGAPRFEVTSDVSTAVPADPVVTEVTLDGAHPNPTRGPAAIRFALPDARAVRLSVIDLLGRTVGVVVEGPRAAGWHEVTLDGSGLAPGVYVVRLDAGDESLVRRMTVAR